MFRRRVTTGSVGTLEALKVEAFWSNSYALTLQRLNRQTFLPSFP